MLARVPEMVRRHPRLHRLAGRVRRLIRRRATAPAAAVRRIHVALPVPPTAPDRPAGRDGLILTAPRGMYVPRRLAAGGLAGYEPRVIATFLAAVDLAGPGSVLDVGANVGLYAALASALTGREAVWAFEPTPDLARTARRFAADNGLPYRVETIALGAEEGTATFYLSDTADTSNSLREGFRTSSRQLEVAVERLDHWCARRDVVPAVVKVDTETTEHDVISGGAEVLGRHRPFILCEVLRNYERRITEVIEPLGYHWYHISGEPPYERVDALVGDPEYRDLMYLFAPEPPTEEFWGAVRAWDESLAAVVPPRPAATR